MPGTTTFQQFNPALNNAQTDAQYLAESMRTGGAVLDALLPSVVFNKFAHQTAMFTAAFCTMLANKGYTTADDNFANLVAVLMNVLTAADAGALIAQIPYATAVSFDASVAAKFDLTLTGNVSSSALVNIVRGQMLVFVIAQDAVGGRTFAWPANVIDPGAISTIANAVSIQPFVVRYNGTSVEPLGPMLQITPSGVIVLPLPQVVSINTSGNISSGYNELIELVDASAGAVTRSIFTAVGTRGYRVRVKKTDLTTNLVNIQPIISGQTVDGFPVVSVTKKNDSLTLISDGANWYIV